MSTDKSEMFAETFGARLVNKLNFHPRVPEQRVYIVCGLFKGTTRF